MSTSHSQDDAVAVELLAGEGCSGTVLDSVRALGGVIKYFDEKVGYVLVALPREKSLQALDISGLAFATVPRLFKSEDFVPAADRKVAPLPTIEIPIPRVATSLPVDGPYFAAEEVGLTELRKHHPDADGRGVRVAVVDQGIDLLHPEIEKVAGENGKLSTKVADIEVVTSPEENDNWVTFEDPIEVSGGTFMAADRTWTAPANGNYRFGIYERKLVLGPEGNSHTKTLSISVGVLWSEKEGKVWVDTDGDGSFKNEIGLSDYGKSQDIVFFGKKEGVNDNRIPFGVKIDNERRAVYVAVATGGHGTHVSGPLAGNRLSGGLFDGAAPNAQLIDVPFGVTKSLSVLRAFARSDAAVINLSGGIGRYNEDGRESFERQVLERAIVAYDKPVASFSAGKNLFLVNDYVSPEMLRRNRQTAPPFVDAMNSFVWFEPDGLVNTLLGPSGSLGIQSRYLAYEWEWRDGKRHTYQDDQFAPPAPAGYMISSNNSPTIPIISGILADLISEARREHVRYSAARLYQALTTSARLIPGFPISEQGYGLVNAAAAWDRLKAMSVGDDPANPELTSFTVARKDIDQLQEVNGWSQGEATVGKTLDGELWITRNGGYAGGRDYRMALRGETDAFSLMDKQVLLKEGVAERVRFKATVEPKWHVAFLQFVDARSGAVMEEVPLSVQGPDVPETVGTGVEKYQATTPPRREEFGNVYLGNEVQAAKFSMQVPYQGPEGISGRYLPPKLRNPHIPYTPAGEPVDAAHHVGPMESLETLFANTKPGIQQFYWENRGSHAEYETPYDEPPAATVPITGTVIVTKYAVAISQKDDRAMTVTNKLADIDGRLELYDARVSSSEQKGDGAHASVDLPRELPAHLSQWRVELRADALPENAADVFLLNCTDAKNGCSVAAQQAIGKHQPALVVENPTEGSWRIVIRTREKTDKAVQYRIREATLTPAASPLEATDSKHASGATWSVALPAKQADAQYAAFHIAGEPKKDVTQNNTAKSGLDIALTPLDPQAP